MEDELWFLQQKYRDLQEYRAEIRAVWDDSAAHELNGRYLNPHEADAEMMQNALVKQLDTLEQVNEKLEIASKLAHFAEKLSLEVSQRLTSADETLVDVYKNLDLSAQYNSKAKSNIPLIYRVIASANDVCGDTPAG